MEIFQSVTKLQSVIGIIKGNKLYLSWSVMNNTKCYKITEDILNIVKFHRFYKVLLILQIVIDITKCHDTMKLFWWYKVLEIVSSVRKMTMWYVY